MTLVELLVVMGIVVLLAAIVLPALGVARGKAIRAKMELDLQAISIAIEAYKQDHGDIPRTSPDGAPPNKGTTSLTPADMNGSLILTRALMGVGSANVDGFTGPGFALRAPVGGVAQGKKWGPYIAPDKFALHEPSDLINSPTNLDRAVMCDRNARPILYYPGRKTVITAANGYVADDYAVRSMFTSKDGDISTLQDVAPMSLKRLQLLLGDTDQNGKIDAPGETPAFTGPFLLISAGLDGLYGPNDDDKPISSSNRCDDLANFPRTDF